MSAVAPADVNAANIANKTIEKMAGESTDLVMKILACVFICLSASMITIYIACFNYPDEKEKKDVTKETTDAPTAKLDEPPNPHRKRDDKAEKQEKPGPQSPSPNSVKNPEPTVKGLLELSLEEINSVGELIEFYANKAKEIKRAEIQKVTGECPDIWGFLDHCKDKQLMVEKECKGVALARYALEKYDEVYERTVCGDKGELCSGNREELASLHQKLCLQQGMDLPNVKKCTEFLKELKESDDTSQLITDETDQTVKFLQLNTALVCAIDKVDPGLFGTENVDGKLLGLLDKFLVGENGDTKEPGLIDDQIAEELANEISKANSIGAMFELIEKFIRENGKFEKFFTFPSGEKLNAFIQQYQNNEKLKKRAIIVCWVLYFLRISKLSTLFKNLAKAGNGELDMLKKNGDQNEEQRANFEALKKVQKRIVNSTHCSTGIAGLVNRIMQDKAAEKVTANITEKNDQERFEIAFLIALQKWCPNLVPDQQEQDSFVMKLKKFEEMLEQEVNEDTKVLSKFTNLIEKTAAKLAPPSSSEFGTFIIPIAAPDMSELPFTGTSI